MGTQEIARYDWNDEALDKIAYVIERLSDPQVDVGEVRRIIDSLPEKKIHYTFSDDITKRFAELMTNI